MLGNNHRRTAPPIRWALGTGLLFIAPMVGCEETPTIRYVKTEAVREAPTTATRTLGAVLPRNAQAWFFKLTGPPEKLAPHAGAFQELVKSVRFAGDQDAQPAWELPEGWKQQAASGMRYATLTRGDGKDQVEISVMALPITGGEVDQYVLTNINRWREQLKLSAITLEQLATETESLEIDGKRAILVDLVGTGDSSGSMGGMGGPMASGSAAGQANLPAGHPPVASSGSGGATPPTGTAAPATPSASGGEPPQGNTPPNPATAQLTYRTPEGWEPGDVRGIRAAAFMVRDGDQSVEITVFQMALAAQDVLSNVNIWRGQIGLSEGTAAQLPEWTSAINVADKPATLVQLVGPESVSPRAAILAVIASRAESVWFFKAIGPAELVEREKTKFLDFIQSVQFKEGI